MKSQNILDEIRSELNSWVQKYGENAFEFSLTTSASAIASIANINAKTIIWYEANGANAVEIYKKVTNEFQLKYDESLRGQYLYIVLKIGY